MKTVFIGGSRRITRLPAKVQQRLSNVVGNSHPVVVGDANGADKAVQKHLLAVSYDKVTVFCSGDSCRNNLGDWPTRSMPVAGRARSFQFHAAKDRAMALAADIGLMIWDGASPGTVLNVLRLVRAGKKAVLINVPADRAHTIRTAGDWDTFLATCSPGLRSDLRERATPEEWQPAPAPRQADLLDMPVLAASAPAPPVAAGKTIAELTAQLNAALAAGDVVSIVDTLGHIAKGRGMGQVAKDAGVARESLYRSLGSGGNPEFATVMKVMSAVGLRLWASRLPADGENAIHATPQPGNVPAA